MWNQKRDTDAFIMRHVRSVNMLVVMLIDGIKHSWMAHQTATITILLAILLSSLNLSLGNIFQFLVHNIILCAKHIIYYYSWKIIEIFFYKNTLRMWKIIKVNCLSKQSSLILIIMLYETNYLWILEVTPLIHHSHEKVRNIVLHNLQSIVPLLSNTLRGVSLYQVILPFAMRRLCRRVQLTGIRVTLSVVWSSPPFDDIFWTDSIRASYVNFHHRIIIIT